MNVIPVRFEHLGEQLGQIVPGELLFDVTLQLLPGALLGLVQDDVSRFLRAMHGWGIVRRRLTVHQVLDSQLCILAFRLAEGLVRREGVSQVRIDLFAVDELIAPGHVAFMTIRIIRGCVVAIIAGHLPDDDVARGFERQHNRIADAAQAAKSPSLRSIVDHRAFGSVRLNGEKQKLHFLGAVDLANGGHVRKGQAGQVPFEEVVFMFPLATRFDNPQCHDDVTR